MSTEGSLWVSLKELVDGKNARIATLEDERDKATAEVFRLAKEVIDATNERDAARSALAAKQAAIDEALNRLQSAPHGISASGDAEHILRPHATPTPVGNGVADRVGNVGTKAKPSPGELKDKLEDAMSEAGVTYVPVKRTVMRPARQDLDDDSDAFKAEAKSQPFGNSEQLPPAPAEPSGDRALRLLSRFITWTYIHNVPLSKDTSELDAIIAECDGGAK